MGCHFLLQGIFPHRDWTHVSCVSCTGMWIICHCANQNSLEIYFHIFVNFSGFFLLLISTEWFILLAECCWAIPLKLYYCTFQLQNYFFIISINTLHLWDIIFTLFFSSLNVVSFEHIFKSWFDVSVEKVQYLGFFWTLSIDYCSSWAVSYTFLFPDMPHHLFFWKLAVLNIIMWQIW